MFFILPTTNTGKCGHFFSNYAYVIIVFYFIGDKSFIYFIRFYETER